MNTNTSLARCRQEAKEQAERIDYAVLEHGVVEAHLKFNVSSTINMTRCKIVNTFIPSGLKAYSNSIVRSMRLYDKPVWEYPSFRRFCYFMAQRLRYNDRERQRKCRERKRLAKKQTQS